MCYSEELEKAREHYLTKKHGKCATCKFSERWQYVPNYYCLVREDFVDTNFLYGAFMVMFCKYYSKR